MQGDLVTLEYKVKVYHGVVDSDASQQCSDDAWHSTTGRCNKEDRSLVIEKQPVVLDNCS